MSFRVAKRRSSATLRLDSSTKVQTMRRISSLEPLEDMVTCPIDLNFLEDPRLLPCGHAFCCECLTRYMKQVIATAPDTVNPGQNVSLFSCPICRATCPIPPTHNAEWLPKAFNHTAILEFLRKTRLSDLRVRATAPQASPNYDPPGPGMNVPCRKTSIQVSSQMLNYIVNDIAAYDKDGKIGDVDKAIILDDVNKLLQRLQANHSDPSRQTAPSAPPADPVAPASKSPSGSTKNLGRFNMFANQLRSSRCSSAGTEMERDLPSYSTYRDIETARLNMKRNSAYHVLAKGKDCCIMRPGEQFQPVDMQMIPTMKNSTVLRCTLTTDVERGDLILWRQQINIERDNFLSETRGRLRNKTPEQILQTQGPLKLNVTGQIKVQYIRFHGPRIYVTCVVECPPENPGSSLGELKSDYGLVVCCSAIGLNAIDPQDATSAEENFNSDKFPVIAISCQFQRDTIGLERRNHPILFGIDIDHCKGDIYIAQPANAMICRLEEQNLQKVSGTWYLNEPQLSPYFLCYAHSTIWATCPQEDKIIIIDLETDGFHHFSPSLSFGITPSHIIYTTDDRIVLLDKTQSRLFWIAKVHKTICVQCLNVQFNRQLKRSFLAIQPVDDAVTSVVSTASGMKNNLQGGVLCAHDYGCSLIYPKREVVRSKPFRGSCLGLCSV